MVVPRSLPHLRLLALVLAVAFGVCAPAAQAQTPAGVPDPTGGQADGDWDGGGAGWDEPSDAAPAEIDPAQIPPGIELPAKPWTPPIPSAPTTPTVPTLPVLPVPKGAMVSGTRALVRADGRAAIPRGAPKRVRVAIAWANRIIGKPYKWGGGHGRLTDSGYDCSGTVGFSLVHAGLMAGVSVSGQMAHWAARGQGRWITVYANSGHAYMEIAGLRLDTSPYGDPTGRMGVRWRNVVGRRPGFAARHPLGL